jgi:hypothetical protein
MHIGILWNLDEGKWDKMFSYAKTEDTLFEIKKALSAYFAQKVEEDMNQLWEEGLWDQEKNESILKEHLRTPYND